MRSFILLSNVGASFLMLELMSLVAWLMCVSCLMFTPSVVFSLGKKGVEIMLSSPVCWINAWLVILGRICFLMLMWRFFAGCIQIIILYSWDVIVKRIEVSNLLNSKQREPLTHNTRLWLLELGEDILMMLPNTCPFGLFFYVFRVQHTFI